MKRTLLIIGILIVAVLLSIWVYIMSSSNDGNESFSLFGFGDTTDQNVPESNPFTQTEDDPIVDIDENINPLQQLTTKPVVGYTEVQKSSTSDPYVYYMEAGTGHVYTININNGVEERISNITIPSVNNAVFSVYGTYVATQSNYNSNSELVSISLPEDTAEEEARLFSVATNISSFTVTDEKLLYLAAGDSNQVGKAFDLETKTYDDILFGLPFYDVAIHWGTTDVGPHYMYPKPNSNLMGYAYKINEGTISRLPASGFGLSVVGNNKYQAYTVPNIEGEYGLHVYNEGSLIEFVDNGLASKCVFAGADAALLICAADRGADITQEAWLRGEANFNDSLFFINMEDGFITPTERLSVNSGRSLDAVNLQTNGQRLLFTNKIDGTLWMYRYTAN